MTATYDAWAADPTLERIILAEIQPAEQLGIFATEAVQTMPTPVSTAGVFSPIASFGSATSIGISMNVATFDRRILIVRLAGVVTSISTVSVTIDGVVFSLTKLTGISGGGNVVEIWYLIAPASSNITTTLTVTGVGFTSLGFAADVWRNVDQSTPFGTPVTSAVTTLTPSIAVTASTTMKVIDVIHAAATTPATLTVGAGQTQNANTAVGNTTRGSSVENGAVSTTMSWTINVGAGVLNSSLIAGVALQGTINLYKVSWLKYPQSTITNGGIYRRLDAIKSSDTNYSTFTLVSTKALCAVTGGTYFYDSVTELIYLNTTNGSGALPSPNTFDFVGAWFTIFLGTTEPEFMDGSPIYEPRLTGVLPQIRGQKPDELFGASIWAEGQLEIANSDAIFDSLSKNWIWENKLVTIKIGGAGFTLADYQVVDMMRIQTINVQDTRVILAIQKMSDILNRSLPPNTIAGATQFLGYVGFLIPKTSAVLSDSAQIIFGTVEDVPLKFLYDTGSFATYIIWDYASSFALTFPLILISTLYAINRTTGERTVLVTSGDINGSISDGTYSLFANYAYRDSQGYDLRADIVQLPSNSLTYIGPGKAAQTVLKLCGESIFNIDTAAFDAADIAAPYAIGFYLNQLTPAAEVLRRIEQSALMQVYMGANGLWTCRVFNPVASTVSALVAEDFATWQADVQDQSVLSEVRVQYQLNPATEGFLEVSRTDSSTAVARETSNTHRILTYLRNKWDAQEVCDRYAFIKQKIHALIKTDQRSLNLINAQPGDLVSITRDRAPSRSGVYSNTPSLIRDIVITLGPKIGVTITLDDMGEVLQLVGVYSDDTGALWSSATAAQKDTLCFYSDDSGYIDPADAATRHRKVYW